MRFLPFLLLAAFAPVGFAGDVPQGRAEGLARYGAGRMQLGKDDLPAAVKNLEAAAKADPLATAPLRDLVTAYTELGRDAAAIRTAKQVLVADPADADMAHMLARLYVSAQRHADAAEVLAPAVTSPKLVKRPLKKLAMLKDLARCRDLANDPPGAEAALLLVQAHLADAAEALRGEGFRDDDFRRERADTFEKLGRVLATRKEYARAATAFRSVEGGDARLTWNLSGVLFAQGDFAGTRQALEPLLAAKPTATEPYERYAAAMRQLGRTEEAIAKLTEWGTVPAKWAAAVEQTRTQFPADTDPFRPLWQLTSDVRFFRAAIAAYAKAQRTEDLLAMLDDAFTAVRPDPDDDAPAAPPANAADRARAVSEAMAASRTALPAALKLAGETAESRRAETLELLAWAADRAGRLDLAETMLRAAMRTPAADKPNVPFALLRLLERQSKWEEVIALCKEGFGRQRGGAFFFYRTHQAEAEAELGRVAEAVVTVGELRDKANVEYYRARARVYLILGRFDDAARNAQDGIANLPTPEQAHMLRYALADAYQGQKQFDKAEAELRAILADDPDETLALNNLGYNLADQGRKLAEAEAMIRRAIELDGDARARTGEARTENAAYLDSLGWVLFRRGKLAEARDQLDRAAGLPEGFPDPTVWDHLGDVCFRLGDARAAKTAWAKALPLYGTGHVGRQNGRLDELKRKLELVN